ncbi:hypothetical protein L1887_56337 [Cichorium endivia]|nr:hypothetical protein L1887_56337 [Cichorium endivia]
MPALNQASCALLPDAALKIQPQKVPSACDRLPPHEDLSISWFTPKHGLDCQSPSIQAVLDGGSAASPGCLDGLHISTLQSRTRNTCRLAFTAEASATCQRSGVIQTRTLSQDETARASGLPMVSLAKR